MQREYFVQQHYEHCDNEVVCYQECTLGGIKMKFRALCATLIAIFSFSAPASAKILWFDYTARVETNWSTVALGTPVIGSFWYDTNLTANSNYYNSFASSSYYASPSIGMKINFNGQAFSGAGHAAVWDGHTPYPLIDPDASDDFDIGFNTGTSYFYISVWGPDEYWLDNTKLPKSFPFPLKQFFDYDGDTPGAAGAVGYYDMQTNARFDATLLSITPSNPAGAVPEPSTWALMILGFGGIGVALRGRRKMLPAVAAG